MIGSLITRALALVLGYAYPAYECFKVVELNRPDIEQLRFWCKYWILVAALTVLERIGDNFISWLPMYSETKVAFFVYLWYPKTRGATYVYETFLQPYVSSHETEIDRNLLELKTRAGDFVFIYWQKAASYGQTRVYEILQYVASQAPSEQSRHRSTGQRQPARQNHQTPASDQTSNVQEAAAPLAQQLQTNTAPASPTKRGNQGSTKTGAGPHAAPTPSQTQSSSGINITQPTASETTSQPLVISGGVNQTSAAAATSTSIADNLQPQDTPMDEAVRMTRGRLRRRAASFDPSAH